MHSIIYLTFWYIVGNTWTELVLLYKLSITIIIILWATSIFSHADYGISSSLKRSRAIVDSREYCTVLHGPSSWNESPLKFRNGGLYWFSYWFSPLSEAGFHNPDADKLSQLKLTLTEKLDVLKLLVSEITDIVEEENVADESTSPMCSKEEYIN